MEATIAIGTTMSTFLDEGPVLDGPIAVEAGLGAGEEGRSIGGQKTTM